MSDEHATCPHCGGEVCMATIAARQKFTIVITANESRTLAAVTIGTAILEVAKSIEATAANMGDSVSVMLESVEVTDGQVAITMMECDNYPPDAATNAD